MSDDPDISRTALQRGASAYPLKDASPDELIWSSLGAELGGVAAHFLIAHALAGCRYLPAEFDNQTANPFSGPTPARCWKHESTVLQDGPLI